MLVRHNQIISERLTFGKNVGLYIPFWDDCVAAIEADAFRCGSFGCRTFLWRQYYERQ